MLRCVLGSVGAGLVALGCREPTQITIALRTDVPCDRLEGVGIVVGPPDSDEAGSLTTESHRCSPSGRLGSLVAVPSGARGAEVSIRVVGAVGGPLAECSRAPYAAHCIVARRSLRYVPHTPLRVPIDLRSSCVGVVCDPSSTCVHGVCRPAALDADSCGGDGCDEDALQPARDSGFTTGSQSCLSGVTVAGRRRTGYAVMSEIIAPTQIGGEFLSPTEGNVAIVGFDEGLATRWSTLLAREGWATPGKLATDDDGDFYACAVLSGRGLGRTGHEDGVLVARLDGNGDPRWATVLSASSAACTAVATRPDGSVLVGGHFQGSLVVAGTEHLSIGPAEDGWVAALDATGRAQWGRALGGPALDVVRGVAPTREGWAVTGVVTGIVGDPIPPGQDEELFVLALQHDGNPVWAKRLPGWVGPWGMASPAPGTICLSAQHTGTTLDGIDVPSEGEDGLVACFDDRGTTLWARGFGGDGTDHFDGIGADADGNVLVTGHGGSTTIDFDGATVTTRPDGDVIVALLSPEGEVRWARSAGSAGFDEGASVAGVSDDAVIVGGWVGAGGADFGGGPLPFLGDTDCSGFVARVERR